MSIGQYGGQDDDNNDSFKDALDSAININRGIRNANKVRKKINESNKKNTSDNKNATNSGDSNKKKGAENVRSDIKGSTQKEKEIKFNISNKGGIINSTSKGSSGGKQAAESGAKKAGAKAASNGVKAGASGGKAAAAGAVKAIGGKYMAIAAAAVFTILFIVLFVIYVFSMPGNIVATATEVAKNVVYTVTDSLSEVAKAFYFGLFPKADPLSDESLEADGILPVDGVDYDSNDAMDMTYLTEYKIFAVAFHDSYESGVTRIKDICDKTEYDYDLTMADFNAKYPNGWEDVYANVNYGDLISVAYMAYDQDNDISKIPTNYVEDLYEKFVEAFESDDESDESDSAFTLPRYYLDNLQKAMLSKDNQKKLYQMGYTIETSDSGEKYLSLEMKPLSMSTYFSLLELDKDSTYNDGIAVIDMMDTMTANIGGSLENAMGSPKKMFNTLKLFNKTSDSKMDWDNSFSSCNIDDLFIPEGTGLVGDSTNAEVVWKTLLDNGINQTAAAAIIGNLMVESGTSLNTSSADASGAIGIAQWMGGRKDALMTYADEQGLSVDDIQAQAGYLAQEVTSGKYGTDSFMNISDLEAATDLCAYNYEACSRYSDYDTYIARSSGLIPWSRYAWSDTCSMYIVDLEMRRNYAQQVFDNLSDKSSDGSSSGGGSGTGTFTFPCPDYTALTSDFGAREDPFDTSSTEIHKGIDLAAPAGTPIYAAAEGTVILATYSETAGNWIKIQHENNIVTVYMHCSVLHVSEGSYVRPGDLIGEVGTTGSSTGNHLHFAVMEDGEYVSPWDYVSTP